MEPAFNSKMDHAESAASRHLGELRKTLWEDGGILRNRQGLERALKAVAAIRAEYVELPMTGKPRRLQQHLELRFALRTAELILQGALRREESRGAHFREDFPVPDDNNWRGHLQVKLAADGELKYTYQPG